MAYWTYIKNIKKNLNEQEALITLKNGYGKVEKILEIWKSSGTFFTTFR